MLLRSGKLVFASSPTTNTPTNKPKCSYCKKVGHKINSCNNIEIIKKINDEIVERTIFSRMVIPYISIAKKYLRLCLCSYTEINLLMLCYYAKIKKYSTEYKKSSYINLLVEYYYQKLNQELNTLTHMLSVISDENYEKYTNEILNNSVSLNLTFEIEEMIINYVYKYRPPQRKFNIQVVTNPNPPTSINNDCPICYETHSPSEIIRTDCSHNYCKDCLTSYFKSLNNKNTPPVCACCRKVIVTLEIRNKKSREEIQKKYCTTQLPPPPEPSRPLEPATPPVQAPPPPPQQNRYGASSSILQRIIFHFVSF
jgi:hypothetical protein